MRLALGAVLALALHGSDVLASGEPQDSLAYKNAAKALQVLDRAIAAHGGPQLLDRSADLRVTFKGTLRRQGHYPRPWASRDTPIKLDWVYSAKLGALKSSLTEETEPPQLSVTIVGPTNGIELGGGKPEPIPDGEVQAKSREEFEFLPQEFLRQARAGAAGLRLLASGDGFDVVHYTLPDGQNRALYIDSKTRLLARVERIDHWTMKGDRLEWRTFDEYADRDGIRVPARSEVHRENESTQYDITTEIVDWKPGAEVKADELTIPAAFRTGFETWALAAPPEPKGQDLLPFHDLGRGTFVIDLPPSDSRALLVGFADFSVVVEAGDRSELGARILRTARSVLPGKPVRYVAMTHHHPLYANALRPYVQQGVTVLATAGNVDYFRELTTRPYRIHPDEQQQDPKDPVIEVIHGTRIIQDKAQRLELHEFDYSSHTDEYVLPYLPSHKLIVTGDMVYILRGDKPGPANVRERAVNRVVAEKKLVVQSIMQTWFLERADMLTPYALLLDKIRLAEEKDREAHKASSP